MYSFVPFFFPAKIAHAVFRCGLFSYEYSVVELYRKSYKSLFLRSTVDGHLNCIQFFGSYEKFC